MSKETYKVALKWLGLGISTIPILYRSKAPAITSWKEFQTILPRESQLKAWFENTQYSIAVICGWQNLVVIDFDCKIAFQQWWHNIADEVILTVECTYKVKTPRGFHLYFHINEMPESVKLDKIDIRVHGNYVLAPPSVHPSGKAYIGYSTSGIQHLNSITDILPDYEKALEQQRTKIQPKPYDAYEDAMRPWVPGNGASIEDIKSKWTIARVLGLPEPPRLAWRTNCSVHSGVNRQSFAAYPDGRWHCYSCGRSGDVIDLYAALHQTDIAGAMREMAAK